MSEVMVSFERAGTGVSCAEVTMVVHTDHQRVSHSFDWVAPLEARSWCQGHPSIVRHYRRIRRPHMIIIAAVVAAALTIVQRIIMTGSRLLLSGFIAFSTDYDRSGI